MRRHYLFLCFLLLCKTSFAQSWQDTVSKIEATVSRYYKSQSPGLQLSISRNGEVIFSRAWGMADLERMVPLTTISILEAGSVSKQFTAAAILLLEQQGKLSLDDDIRKYIPELPDYGNIIRLRHLLHHTSGLRDWGSVSGLTGWSRGKKFYSNNDALEIIARQKRLNNIPGDEYIYSNSNYNLQAIIVQRVSGLALADYTRKYIFEPAQMQHTSWRDNPNRIVSNRAIAYSTVKDGFEIDMPNEYVYGNGGLLTTTDDLLKWNTFYLAEKLGGSSLLARQTQTEPFNNGAQADYAAGLLLQKINGWNTINHGGATAGYRANLVFFRELNLSIAVLSNTPQNFVPVTNAIQNLFVTDRSEKEEVKAAANKPAEATLVLYKGWYKNERDGSGFEVSSKDQSLLLGKTALQPLAHNKFSLGGHELLFNGNKGLYRIIPGKDTIHYSRVAPAMLSTALLSNYAGSFFSEETSSTIVTAVEKDSLIMRIKPDEVVTLLPSYKDGFRSADGLSVFFTRNNQGKIDNMLISVVPRARKVEFKKVR